MFRVPKSSPIGNGAFYEADYEQGSTTQVPDDARLEDFKRNSFRDIGKDYSGYIEVLQAAGVKPQGIIYDYGSSWGYGSWQFSRSGYRVFSYEIAKTRAAFAEEKLGCWSLSNATDVPEKVDCLFASHVLEHLPDPSELWNTAVDVLKPDGVVLVFVPNGEPSRERLNPRLYHQLWGRVHPLLLTAASLNWMAQRYGFRGVGYSTPYDLVRIAQGLPGRLDGDELLFVGRRQTE